MNGYDATTYENAKEKAEHLDIIIQIIGGYFKIYKKENGLMLADFSNVDELLAFLCGCEYGINQIKK